MESKRDFQVWESTFLERGTKPKEQIPESDSRTKASKNDARRNRSNIQIQLGLETTHAALNYSQKSVALDFSVFRFTINIVVSTPHSFLTNLLLYHSTV